MLAGVASIQFGAALAATLFAQAGPAGTAALRLSFAALVLLGLTRPAVRDYPPPRLRLAALLGLVLAAMNLSFYEALARIPLGAAVTVEFVGPLAVAVATSRRALDLLWVALAAAGILLLSGGLHGAHSSAGLALAALAGCFWAAYILVNARAAAVFPGASGLAMGMTVGAAAVLGPGIAGGGSNLVDLEVLALGLAVALLGSVIPYSLETEALRRLRPGVFSVLMSLEPAVAALAGFLILGQRLSGAQAIAIALVVVASAGASRAEAPVPLEA